MTRMKQVSASLEIWIIDPSLFWSRERLGPIALAPCDGLVRCRSGQRWRPACQQIATQRNWLRRIRLSDWARPSASASFNLGGAFPLHAEAERPRIRRNRTVLPQADRGGPFERKSAPPVDLRSAAHLIENSPVEVGSRRDEQVRMAASQARKERRNEWSSSLGGHQERCVRPDRRWKARAMERRRPSLRWMGDLPHEGIAGESEPDLCIANQLLVRPGDPAFRRRRQVMGDDGQHLRL